MAKYLRTVRQSRWLQHPLVSWLQPNELKGDVLSDLQPHNGDLSVFKIVEEADKDRILTAFAAARDSLQIIDYAIFDDTRLLSSGISSVQSAGVTPDNVVNENLHYDLKSLTTFKIISLTEIIATSEMGRVSKKQISDQIRVAILRGILDRSMVKDKILRDVGLE